MVSFPKPSYDFFSKRTVHDYSDYPGFRVLEIGFLLNYQCRYMGIMLYPIDLSQRNKSFSVNRLIRSEIRLNQEVSTKEFIQTHIWLGIKELQSERKLGMLAP